MSNDRIPVKNARTGLVEYVERTVTTKVKAALTDSPIKISTPRHPSATPETEKQIPERVAKKKKPDAPNEEMETLEQFLSYAYGLRGRRISTKQKFAASLSVNVKTTEEERARLHALFKDDRGLAVLRQLILANRKSDLPAGLRGGLRDFIRDSLLSHSAFQMQEVQAAIRNLPEAPSLPQILRLVLGNTRNGDNESGKADLHEAKLKTAYCLAVWIAECRNAPIGDLLEAINSALWAPNMDSLQSDTERIRALTEVSETVGVALACEHYKQRAMDQARAAENERRISAVLREKLSECESLLQSTRSEHAIVSEELSELRRETEGKLQELISTAESTGVHLRDDNEQLRARILRRLVTDVEYLDVALAALNDNTPRPHVVKDRIERVLDTLRSEIKKLREE